MYCNIHACVRCAAHESLGGQPCCGAQYNYGPLLCRSVLKRKPETIVTAPHLILCIHSLEPRVPRWIIRVRQIVVDHKVHTQLQLTGDQWSERRWEHRRPTNGNERRIERDRTYKLSTSEPSSVFKPRASGLLIIGLHITAPSYNIL